jgi:hypothetical protein
MVDRGGATVSPVNRDDFRSLLYLISLSVVGVVIVGVFFGVGFLWLIDPNPATPSVHPVPSAQALEAHEVTAPANNGSERGSSSAPPADKVVASPTPSAPSEQEPAASASTAIETALIPPSRITHGNKRMWVRRRRHEVTVRHWGALWRPDASAGPNPGGGFYDGPNINVGRINPK